MPINLEDVEFLDPSHQVGVEVQVGTHTIMMFPVSPLVVPRFQKIMKTVLPSFRELFYRYTDEGGQRTQREADGKGRTTEEVVILPVDPGLSTTHRNFREKSIREACDGLLSEEGLIQVALCVLDSARDTFAREPGKLFTNADARELLSKMTIPQLLPLVVGLVKANLQSFPLGQKAAAKAVAKMEEGIDRFGQDGYAGSDPEAKKEDTSDE